MEVLPVVHETETKITEEKIEEKKEEPIVEVQKVDEVKDDNQSSNINVIDAEGEKSDIPPLPENPPPSQVMAFVESVIDNPSETIIAPVQKTVESLVQETLPLIESVKEEAKAMLDNAPKVVEETIVAATETIKEELVAPVADAIEQILEEASDKVSQIEKEESEEPKTEQIEETIALLDKVNQGVLPSDESSENLEASPTSPVVEEVKADDISSLPLPQESFESLSSPPTSNNESQSDNSFPPPPPPETLVDQSEPVDEPKVEQPSEPAEDKVIKEHDTTSNHVSYHSLCSIELSTLTK